MTELATKKLPQLCRDYGICEVHAPNILIGSDHEMPWVGGSSNKVKERLRLGCLKLIVDGAPRCKPDPASKECILGDDALN